MLNIQRLQKEMDRFGYSQRQFADEIGVTEVSMSRYCNGIRTPRASILSRMASTLGVTQDYLLGVDKYKNSDFPFRETWINIREYADEWTKDQKKELVSMLLETL